MTSSAKRKVSITLDADLVAAMEADGSTTLSAEVNSALRTEFTRRKRQQALAALLDRLASALVRDLGAAASGRQR